WLNLVKEKWAFFLLSAVSCAVTVWAQHQGGAIKSLENIPLGLRLANAVTAYGLYLMKTIWPIDLAILYPMPKEPPLCSAVFSGVILIAITAVVLWRGRRPQLAVGWLWFLGTLVPVIGLVQVGGQAMADRYTYIPLIGIFIAAVWAVENSKAERSNREGLP